MSLWKLKHCGRQQAVQPTELMWFYLLWSKSDGLANRMLFVHLGTTIHKPSRSLLVTWLLFIGHHPREDRIQQPFIQLQSLPWREKDSLLPGVSSLGSPSTKIVWIPFLFYYRTPQSSALHIRTFIRHYRRCYGYFRFQDYFKSFIMGQFQLMPNNKLIIVSQIAHTQWLCVEIFWSKIPVLSVGQDSQAFIISFHLH